MSIRRSQSATVEFMKLFDLNDAGAVDEDLEFAELANGLLDRCFDSVFGRTSHSIKGGAAAGRRGFHRRALCRRTPEYRSSRRRRLRRRRAGQCLRPCPDAAPLITQLDSPGVAHAIALSRDSRPLFCGSLRGRTIRDFRTPRGGRRPSDSSTIPWACAGRCRETVHRSTRCSADQQDIVEIGRKRFGSVTGFLREAIERRAAMRPSFNAACSASSLTMPPRAELMRYASGFIRDSSRSPMRFASVL